MHRILQSFFERLTERIVAMAGSMVAATVEVERTTQQAEQLSQLEDLARRMEAEGKEDIAESIRARMQTHVADNPAANADRLIENVVVESAVPRLDSRGSEPPTGKPASSKPKNSRKSGGKRSSGTSLPPLNLPAKPAAQNSEAGNDTH